MKLHSVLITIIGTILIAIVILAVKTKEEPAIQNHAEVIQETDILKATYEEVTE